MSILLILVMVSIVLSMGILEHFVGGDLIEAQNKIKEVLGIPFSLFLCIFMGIVFITFLILWQKE